MASSDYALSVSNAQLEALFEFLNTHRDIAMGYNESTETRLHYQNMWERVTQFLNSLDGDIRDWKGWSDYWIEYKAKLKKKVAALQAVNGLTGAGPSRAEPLSEVEQRFYDILGNSNGLGTSRMARDPFSDDLVPSCSSGSSTSQWVDENGNSTQTQFRPINSISVSTQAFDMEEPIAIVPVRPSASKQTVSTGTVRAVVAATQTTPQIGHATTSTGLPRRRRRVSTPYPMETRRSLSVAAFAPNGLATRTHAFGGMIGVLSRMVRALERIEARLSANQRTQLTGA